MWSRMSKGEREEGKEGKGWGRSGRAWWAEERIWAFTPREEEQDQVAVWRPGHRWEGTREEAVPWQVLAGLRPQATGDGERQPGSRFVNFFACGEMCITY